MAVRDYPLVEYAQKIGKNTAELTTSDMSKFTKEWMKQPVRKDLIAVTPEQRTQYNKDVVAMSKYRDAQTGRLAGKQLDDELVGDSEIMNYVSEEDQDRINDGVEIVSIVSGDGAICSMELTKADVIALQWALSKIFEDYDLTNSEMEAPLKSLLEGLEGV